MKRSIPIVADEPDVPESANGKVFVLDIAVTVMVELVKIVSEVPGIIKSIDEVLIAVVLGVTVEKISEGAFSIVVVGM